MFTPETAFWILVVWLVAIGGAVGSFLNVVVYRLPQGISLIYPPSRCPNCEKRIPWYDNVPVFGWLWLRGRCRQCENPISARYPIVEAITAAMFGVVAVVELPYMSQIGFYGIYPYHLLLLCTLLCAALIEYDGNQVPWSLFVPALVVGFAAPLAWPTLRPMSAWLVFSRWESPPEWLIGVVFGLLGLTVGAVWGFIAWGSFDSEKPKGLALGLVCVGLFLGWEAVSIIAMCTALLIAPKPVSLRLCSVMLGIVTLAWIIVWAPLFAS